jgi:hypothetical protein
MSCHIIFKLSEKNDGAKVENDFGKMATYRIYVKDKNMNGHDYFLFPKKQIFDSCESILKLQAEKQRL